MGILGQGGPCGLQLVAQPLRLECHRGPLCPAPRVALTWRQRGLTGVCPKASLPLFSLSLLFSRSLQHLLKNSTYAGNSSLRGKKKLLNSKQKETTPGLVGGFPFEHLPLGCHWDPCWGLKPKSQSALSGPTHFVSIFPLTRLTDQFSVLVPCWEFVMRMNDILYI